MAWDTQWATHLSFYFVYGHVLGYESNFREETEMVPDRKTRLTISHVSTAVHLLPSNIWICDPVTIGPTNFHRTGEAVHALATGKWPFFSLELYKALLSSAFCAFYSVRD